MPLAYSKLIVAILTTIAVVCETVWPAARWEHAVTVAIGAILVYLVPNLPGPGSAIPDPGGSSTRR